MVSSQASFTLDRVFKQNRNAPQLKPRQGFINAPGGALYFKRNQGVLSKIIRVIKL
ncbi:MAG: hypothetical protein ACFB0A_01270 [Croceivirga sp.]